MSKSFKERKLISKEYYQSKNPNKHGPVITIKPRDLPFVVGPNEPHKAPLPILQRK